MKMFNLKKSIEIFKLKNILMLQFISIAKQK